MIARATKPSRPPTSLARCRTRRSPGCSSTRARDASGSGPSTPCSKMAAGSAQTCARTARSSCDERRWREPEEAWAAVHTVLPAEERHRPRHVVAIDLRSRTLRKEYVEATGWTEAEALRELAALLGSWHVEDVEAGFD